MRLLVSVRSAAEVRPALAGGADIIDAKEPSLGSLGAVSRTALREIGAAVPRHIPLSVALGDLTGTGAVVAAIADVRRVVGERAELYVKLGLSGVPAGNAARLALAAVDAARRVGGARVILVAYADHATAGSPAPDEVTRVASRAGAAGVLLDTFGKDGRDLFRFMDESMLREWVVEAARNGQLVALAGSLDGVGVERVGALPAHVVGVRSAACTGGRSGVVDQAKVRALKDAVERSAIQCAVL